MATDTSGKSSKEEMEEIREEFEQERRKTHELRDKIKAWEAEIIMVGARHRQEIGSLKLSMERREGEFKRVSTAEEEVNRQNTELRLEVEALKKVG